MEHPYPHFHQALLTFGQSSYQIAKALGVSQRSAAGYLRGDALPHVRVVKRHPVLDIALTYDLNPRGAPSIKRVHKIAKNMLENAPE